jgi:tetratricopeptide (TPR) repeat protein
MDPAEAIDPLITVLQSDSASICRRSALEALSNLNQRIKARDLTQNQKSKELFVNLLTDADEIIRFHSARALKKFAKEPGIIDALTQSLDDSSVYVQRAAAKSLALNGIKAGIPVLIETLRYPSIDTFEHYDNELVKDLSYYTGVDFPKEKRYNYHTWQRWWQKNSSRVDLQQNLVIMQKITRALSAPQEELGITIFERLIDEHPQNVVVKKRYKRFCYEWVTYRLLTRKKIDNDILKRCLRLQKIAVALEPDDPQAMASMAYFLVRLNKFNEAIAAIQNAIHLDPDDAALRETLEHYQGLKNRSKTIDDS